MWDVEAAERFFRFCEHVLRLNGGEFEGKPFVLHESQKFICGSIFGWKRKDGNRRFRTAFIEEGKGNGKALALDTPIPTPAGWTTMGALRAGDEVLDEDRRPCRVVQAHPVSTDRECYEIEFSGGATVVASAEHLWCRRDRTTVSTGAVARELEERNAARRNPVIRAAVRLFDACVVRCERVDTVPVRCITVDSPSSMFLCTRSMIPTHNSPLAAGIALYGLVADYEPRAEIYSAAAKKDQANILFRDAVAMVDQSPDLNEVLTRSGRNPVWNLAYLKNGSFFRPIASDNAQSGPRPHIALLDEVHEHKTGLMVEMMRAGTKGRRQALILMITNSGADRTSVCWHYHDYGARVAAGTIEDDSFFSYIAALDEDDDPFADDSCWIKANPLLGVTIPYDYVAEQVREARGMPAKESLVRRLNFCQWVGAESPWISSDVWMAARDDGFSLAGLEGRRCYGGLDLSSTTDLTAFVLLFEPTDDDPHWRQLSWFWIPADGLMERERRDKVPYSAWRAGGWLEATPGTAVDKRSILARLVASATRYDIASIAFDRWRIEDLKALMDDEGIELPLVPFGQGFKAMAPAVDEYERLLVSGELRHDGNPVLTSHAANAVIDMDPAGNRKLTKRRATGRVDGIVASVMAAGIAAGARKDYDLVMGML